MQYIAGCFKVQLWGHYSSSFISDNLEDSVATNILKFSNDTKMFRQDNILQEDLNRLVQRSEKWQMLFNQSKCKCLHIGQTNGKESYEMHNLRFC